MFLGYRWDWGGMYDEGNGDGKFFLFLGGAVCKYNKYPEYCYCYCDSFRDGVCLFEKLIDLVGYCHPPHPHPQVVSSLSISTPNPMTISNRPNHPPQVSPSPSFSMKTLHSAPRRRKVKKNKNKKMGRISKLVAAAHGTLARIYTQHENTHTHTKHNTKRLEHIQGESE